MSNLIIVLIAFAPTALAFLIVVFWRPSVAHAATQGSDPVSIAPYAIPNILSNDSVQRELELAIDEMF